MTASDAAEGSSLVRGQVDIFDAKDMNRNILAVMAGLLKFLPMPPNSCLTTIMAIKHPSTACHIGKFEGTLKAISSPVKAADKSPMVCFLCMIALNAYSKITLAATQTSVSSTTLAPNMYMPATHAGMSASITVPIRRVVSDSVTICGEEDTIKLS